ncbi:MAG TPA: tetratricopeptide repeat protein [Blastocatellia bacterium]|nr:tetratricopeptide repeat protein [Blastocatellia bacterium]
MVLELSTGGIAGETFSDSVGNFEFRSVSSNTYRVVVPGDGRVYDTTQEQVEVYGNFSRTFMVQVYLKDKSSEFVAKPKGKTLSAAEFKQKIPKEAAKLYEKGEKKAREGKPDEAIPLLRESLKAFPDYLLALNKLGEQYLTVQKPAEAQAAFEKALAVDSKFPLAHINLGMLFYHLKNYPEAIKHLVEANHLDESFPMSHLYLGLALMDTQPADLDQAERELLKARTLGGPEMVKVRQHLCNLNLRRRAWDKAAEQLEAYLQEAPNAPDVPAVREMLGKLKKMIAQQAGNPQKP